MNPSPRKLEIISVASTLFKEKGYSAVTMRDIAKVMGIKAASLYNHIKKICTNREKRFREKASP